MPNQATPQTDWDKYVASQVEFQTNPPTYTGQSSLDFSPFQQALDTTDTRRLEQIGEWVFTLSVSALLEKMHQDELTARELTLGCIYRIQQLNDRFRAVLELNPDALKIAEALDQSSTKESLYGIPVLLKGNIGTGDQMHNSAGAMVLRDARSDRDAFLVEGLRQAGCVILGKANLSEWANFMSEQSSNGFSMLGGQTRNPYGAFDVGGSSAGSASGVALGFAPLAVGTETTGSISYPVAQNSIVGLKPSVGLISRDRIIPITDAFDTAGPMGKTVEDVARMMNALVYGVDENDPRPQDASAGMDVDFTAKLSAEALQGVRVGLIQREEVIRTGDHLLWEQAREILMQAGAEMVEIPTLDSRFEEEVQELRGVSFELMQTGMAQGVREYLEATNHDGVRTVDEIVAWNAADLPNRASYGQELLELLPKVSAEWVASYAEKVKQTVGAYGEHIRTVLQEQEVAFLADFSNYSSMHFARSGFPAVILPAGYRETGEPHGITFFGDYLMDADLLAYAYAFEQARPVRVLPKL